jgi:hypothetical protein
MTGKAPRELLAEADREREIARGAESIRCTFRLGAGLAVKPGRFGVRRMFRRPAEPEFQALDSAASMALYRAAGIVRDDARKRADQLEGQVTTQGTTRVQPVRAAIAARKEDADA